MSWLDRFRRPTPYVVPDAPATTDRGAIADYFTFNGFLHDLYPTQPNQTLAGSPQEDAPTGFVSTVQTMHRRNGTVAAAVTARALLVSQLRFQWRSEIDDRLFGNANLAPLERPGPLA